MTRATGSTAIVINTRFQNQELTGVQRYGHELMARFPHEYREIGPSRPPSSIGGHVWEQFTLPRLMGESLLWSPGNTGPLRVRKQVVTIHDASTLDHPEWFSKKFAVWYRFLLPRLARRVRKVITVSEFSRQRLIETCEVPAGHVVAIPNGIDPCFQPSPPADIERFRQENRLEHPYFLYLGSLEPRKNISILLKAWQQLNLVDAELILGGSIGKVFRNAGFAELPPRTRLWGRVSEADLPHLLSGATGFLFPSLYEGFGFPALEAMACGCPALVSSSTCLPEICGPAFDAVNGTGNALYCDPLDAEAWAAGMTRLLALDESTRAQLSRNGRARAAEFTWERSAALTWQVLQEEAHAR